jgi:hypothetical protein
MFVKYYIFSVTSCGRKCVHGGGVTVEKVTSAGNWPELRCVYRGIDAICASFEIYMRRAHAESVHMCTIGLADKI